MSQQGPAKRGKLADFRRACRFLYPHRRLVAVSVLCALVVGVAFTCSLGTMLPVFNVLLSGESAQTWIDRSIAQKRISARLSPDNDWTALANPAARQALAKDADGKLVNVELEAVPWYLRAGRDLVGILPASPVAAVAWVLGFIALLTVFGNVVRFFQEYLSEKAAVLAVNDLRRKLYNHALHLPLSFFSLKGTSDVTSRLTQEAHVLQEGLKSVLGQSVQEPIKAAMAFALAMIASWKLTLFICIFAPLGVLVIRKFGKKMRRASRVMLQESAAMLGQIESSLAGIRVVKASTAERFERRQYGKVMDGLIDQQLRMSRIDAMNTPALETVNMLVVSAVVLYAAYLVVVAQTLAAGTFMLVMACLIGIGESLRRVGKINNVLQKSNSSAARMFEILDVPTEADRGSADSGLPAPNEQSAIQKPKSKIQNLPPLSRSIVFDRVTFTYAGASAPAVDDVSLVVPRGRCVAVVGRNGSGKTTLLALLPRFYDPQSGCILIDDVDTRLAALSSLRRQIAIVTQDSVIFPGTIAHNIAYGLPMARREDIVSAAQRAFAHDFIMEKPDGYDTLVGEHGATLSGGQKQRLCIARAILRRAPILILDEATSQVDAQSEHLIQKAVESVMHERTTFVIAHRFSTIQAADTIVVLERGRLEAQGRHEDLLASCEVYRQLYQRQLVGTGT